LLIAASPIFAAVDLPPDDDFELEFLPVLLLDFAIASLLFDAIDTQVEQQFRCGNEKTADSGLSRISLRGPPATGDPLEHGQRPEVTAVRPALMADEHPFPTCLLNHETSDHLLSLR
jgi:hypothetical protein